MSTKVYLPTSAFASLDKVILLRSKLKARYNKLTNYFINVLDRNPTYLKFLNQELDKLQALSLRLDNNSVICNAYSDVLNCWKEFPSTFELHCVYIFGSFTKKKYDPRFRLNVLQKKMDYFVESGRSGAEIADLRKHLDFEEFCVRTTEDMFNGLKDGTAHGRKAEIERRLYIELEHRNAQGWFFVFNTLTVAPGSMDAVFPGKDVKRSKVWTDYIRTLDRFFCEAAGMTVREGQRLRKTGDDFHTYFAVVETGSETGRLHIHVLHCFKALPKCFFDPNRGAKVARFREIAALKPFWSKYGWSTPIAVRFSFNDNYAKAGWSWPCVFNEDLSTYQPLPAKGFGAIITYMGKYVTKNFINKEPGCIWRTRMSRRLGSQPIQKVLMQMPLKSRLTLLTSPKLKVSFGMTRLPRMLVRRLLLKSLPLGIFTLLYLRSLLFPPNSLFKRLSAMIRRTPVFSPLNAGVTVIRTTRVMDVCKYFQVSNFPISLAGATYV